MKRASVVEGLEGSSVAAVLDPLSAVIYSHFPRPPRIMQRL